ncbi:MAG: Peptidase [Ilumatobacteraceae bacterium]|nr:Peptidase [Ilumatobacteraceae bacterium]
MLTVLGATGLATPASGWSFPRRPPSTWNRLIPDQDVYRPPTAAPVLDPFRPPPQPWLPGNRGIEYGTVPGSVVTAIGRGRVAFAGPVAGRLVVSIDHPGGLRSTYTGLAEIAVARGQLVAGGAEVGRTDGPFHLGVRRGDAYLDPALLWGRAVGAGRVFLVPDP